MFQTVTCCNWAREHPEFLPAVSIHPARPDAIEELERCLADGAVMMKCLPNCHNIDCNDRRYARFWERLAAAGLPLLATRAANTPSRSSAGVLRSAHPAAAAECGVTAIAPIAARRAARSTRIIWGLCRNDPEVSEPLRRFQRV